MSYAEQVIDTLVQAGLPDKYRNGIVSISIDSDGAAAVVAYSNPPEATEDGLSKLVQIGVFLQ
jgi:hypothetical protein